MQLDYSTAHLDIPHRVAIVIDRCKTQGGEDTVDKHQFAAEPETCDLSEDTIRANIGKAKKILAEGLPDLVRFRAERLKLAVDITLGLMPAEADIFARLRHAEPPFSNAEIADLWEDVIARSAERFHVRRAPKASTGLWGRDMLEASAH